MLVLLLPAAAMLILESSSLATLCKSLLPMYIPEVLPYIPTVYVECITERRRDLIR
jgi:hypothetical protein